MVTFRYRHNCPDMSRKPGPLAPDQLRRLQDAAMLLRACAKAQHCRKVDPAQSAQIKDFVASWLVMEDEKPDEADIARAMGDVAVILAAYKQADVDNHIRSDGVAAVLKSVEKCVVDAENLLVGSNEARVTRLLLDEAAFAIGLERLPAAYAELDAKRGRWRLFPGLPAAQRRTAGKIALRAAVKRRVLSTAARATTAPGFRAPHVSVEAAVAEAPHLQDTPELDAIRGVAANVDVDILRGPLFGMLHQAISRVRETLKLAPEVGGLDAGVSPPGGAIIGWAVFELHSAWRPTGRLTSPHPLSAQPTTTKEGALVNMASDLHAIAEGLALRTERRKADSATGADWVKRAIKAWRLGLPTTVFRDAKPRTPPMVRQPHQVRRPTLPRGRTWYPGEDGDD